MKSNQPKPKEQPTVEIPEQPTTEQPTTDTKPNQIPDLESKLLKPIIFLTFFKPL